MAKPGERAIGKDDMKQFTYMHILAHIHILQQVCLFMCLCKCDRYNLHIAISAAIKAFKVLQSRLIQIPYAHKLMHIRTYRYSIDIGAYIQTSNHSQAVLGHVSQQARSQQNAESHTQRALQCFSPAIAHTHIYAHT